MIEKCSIENINGNMHYIGLIILAVIVCIVFLYYIKITNAQHQEIVEKYTENKVVSSYLNTGIEIMHDTNAGIIDSRFPTLNNLATSTATLRPCEIHFNKDGTSKYVFEDGWKELDVIHNNENSSFKVPNKIFATDYNNANDDSFINFTETSKCFKIKGTQNSYKYKSNDLITYNLNSYVKIKDTTTGIENEYMRMNFVKNNADANPNYYNARAMESICSYNYNTNLNLENLGSGKLYRLKINRDDNMVDEIKNVSIKENQNHITNIGDSIDYSQLLGINGSFFNKTETGQMFYNINGNNGDYFITIRIYKFNRNSICSEQIKSYETYNKKINTGLLIYIPQFRENITGAIIPTIANISDTEKNEIIQLEKKFNEKGLVFNEFGTDVDTYMNTNLTFPYESKDKLSTDLLNNIYKLIAIANKQKAKDYSRELDNIKEKEGQLTSFVNSIDSLDKLIGVYLGTSDNKLPILEHIIGTTDLKLFNKNCVAITDYNENNIKEEDSTIPNIELLKENSEPIYEYITYTLNTQNKSIQFSEDTACDILLVAGGGGGGKNGGCEGGGGGGGGGVIHVSNFTLKANTTYNIEVGRGGDKASGGSDNTTYGGNGGNTKIFNSTQYIIAKGGGGGGPGTPERGTWAIAETNSGGSGGGGSAFGGGGGGGRKIGIEHNMGVSLNYIEYGNNGGGNYAHTGGGGGGGGAASAGGHPNGNIGGNGGDGINISIFGNGYYGAGGGGSTGNGCRGHWPSPTWDRAGNGGIGGGGNGGQRGHSNGIDGTPNSGSGGGGASYAQAGNGGSGIVIIRYIRKVIITDNSKIISINYNDNQFKNYKLKVNKKSTITFNDSRQFELLQGTINIVKSRENNVNYWRLRSELSKEIVAKEKITEYKHDPASNSLNTTHETTFENDIICDILVVGGGGGGGTTYTHFNGWQYPGGGGGAGALIYEQDVKLKAGTYNIIVGNGGKPHQNGSDTVIRSNGNIIYKAIGGGGGGTWGVSISKDGGSGGGGGYNGGDGGVSLNTNIPVKKYGFNGSSGYTGRGGGGGGAGSDGTNGFNQGGNGGNGKAINITNANIFYAGGGGGGGGGTGGSGVGGSGNGGNGLYSSGSGGGGGGSGGSGGSGIVIIKIKGISENLIYSSPSDILNISYITPEEEYLNNIRINTLMNMASQSLIKEEGNIIDTSTDVTLNIGSKAINKYKKINVYLSHLSSHNLNINNIVVQYTTDKSNVRRPLTKQEHYEIINLITDSSLQFQKTLRFDILLKTKINMDKIYIILPRNKFYFINLEKAPQIFNNDYTKYLYDKIKEKSADLSVIFGVNALMEKVKKIINERIYKIINRDNILEIINNTNSTITQLKDAYNKIIAYNTTDKKSQAIFRKADIVNVFKDTISESIDNIKSKYISYESPDPRISQSANIDYSIDKVSNNYIYFTTN